MSCPDCFVGTVHQHGEPQGSFQELYGYQTYVTYGDGSNSNNTNTGASKSTILFLPDAFSLRLVNNKLLADRYAQETGFRVLIPDIIPGGGAPPVVMYHMENLLRPGRSWWNPSTWLYKASCLARALWHMIPFMIQARAPKVYPSILKYARAVKSELPSGGKLGVAGFCWGGYGATNLCIEGAENDHSKENLIDASFTAHPSFLKLPSMVINAITKRRVPFSCAVAEKDFMLNGRTADDIELELRKFRGGHRSNTYEFKTYAGANHGFAVRANPDVKVEAQALEDAADQAVAWYKKHLA